LADGSFAITEKEQYAHDVYRMRVRAPLIPPAAKAGQRAGRHRDDRHHPLQRQGA